MNPLKTHSSECNASLNPVTKSVDSDQSHRSAVVEVWKITGPRPGQNMRGIGNLMHTGPDAISRRGEHIHYTP